LKKFQDTPISKAGWFKWDASGSMTITNTSGTPSHFTVGRSNATNNTATISSTSDGTDFFYGVGGSYDIDENMAVRADFTRYKLQNYGENQKVDTIGAALVVKF